MAKGKKTGGRLIEPGTTGNPHGRPRLDYMTQEARALTRSTVITAMHTVMEMPHTEIAKLANIKLSPEAIGAQALMASVLSKAISKGDPKGAQFFMSYLFGRPVEYDPKEDESPAAGSQLANSLSSEILTEVLRVHEAKLKANAAS